MNVDCIAYDLEDSVTTSKKPEARKALAKFLDQPRATGIRENAVRINAVESGIALDDLSEVVRCGLSRYLQSEIEKLLAQSP